MFDRRAQALISPLLQAGARTLVQLGVGADEAEFDVIEEPRPGLFGRMRGEARLRARVRG